MFSYTALPQAGSIQSPRWGSSVLLVLHQQTFPQHLTRRVALTIPTFEHFIGHLSGKTSVERKFLCADIAFSQRHYFRMINLSLAAQNGCE